MLLLWQPNIWCRQLIIIGTGRNNPHMSYNNFPHTHSIAFDQFSIWRAKHILLQYAYISLNLEPPFIMASQSACMLPPPLPIQQSWLLQPLVGLIFFLFLSPTENLVKWSWCKMVMVIFYWLAMEWPEIHSLVSCCLRTCCTWVGNSVVLIFCYFCQIGDIVLINMQPADGSCHACRVDEFHACTPSISFYFAY